MKTDALALVVVPTYNEALNLETLAERLFRACPDCHLLIVDDNSPDGTARVAQSLVARYPERAMLLRREKKLGRGAAVMAGFREGLPESRYSRFVEMDGDLSHAPEALPQLLAESRGVDVVIGSRYVRGGRIEGWGLHRRLWSGLANRLIHLVLRLPISDYTNGYRVYSRLAVERLAAADLRERGFICLTEWAVVLHRAGFRFSDLPTVFINRQRGDSNMSAAEAVGALRALFRLARSGRG